MTKKTAFFLFVLSFIVGFMLRDMLSGVSSFSAGLQKSKENTVIASPSVGEGAAIFAKPVSLNVKIVKLTAPKKVIGGTAFELFVLFEPQEKIPENYYLAVRLKKDGFSRDLGEGNYLKITVAGLVMVPVPAGMPLGEYAVEVELFAKDEDTGRMAPVSGGTTSIEVVNKYL